MNPTATLRLAASDISKGCEPHISEDACIYAGSATWDMWQNHVPLVVQHLWQDLGEEARLAVYITAKAFTNYRA